jgi:hypothetical protein
MLYCVVRKEIVMDTHTTTLHPHDPTLAVCTHCPNGHNCWVLEACLRILASTNDSAGCAGPGNSSRRRERFLRERIASTGYRYPVGKKRCSLAEDPRGVKDLIEEALETLQGSYASDTPPGD